MTAIGICIAFILIGAYPSDCSTRPAGGQVAPDISIQMYAVTEVLLVQPRLKNGVVLPDPVINIEGEALKVVSKFKYVGSLQNTTADITDEVGIRIQRMAVAYKQKRTILFENKRIKLSVRLRAFSAFVITAGVYGCETWNSTAKDIDRLESKQFWYLRRILNYHWKEMKSFADLIFESRKAGVNILPISALVHISRLSYFGHINRMSDSRYPKIFINAECRDGRRLKGGAEITYKKVVLNDLKAFCISTDFNCWSKLVKKRGRLLKTTICRIGTMRELLLVIKDILKSIRVMSLNLLMFSAYLLNQWW